MIWYMQDQFNTFAEVCSVQVCLTHEVQEFFMHFFHVGNFDVVSIKSRLQIVIMSAMQQH